MVQKGQELKFLKTLTMKNFRSWKDGFIEFSPGVNVIAGENDVGKSGILGALDWVINNRPLGNDIRSHWGGDTDVLIEIENKQIGRHKCKNNNLYTLIHEDGRKDIFHPFKGVKVPDAIAQFLNIKPINISSQFDPSFLLSQSPADVARYYNEAVNLDIIDRSISNINRQLRDEKGQLVGQEQLKERLSKQLGEFEWLDEAEVKLIDLEKAKSIITQKESEFSALSELMLTLKSFEEELKGTLKVTCHEKQLLFLIDKQKVLNKLIDEEEELDKYISMLNDWIAQGLELQVIISFEASVDNFVQLNTNIETRDKEYRELESFIDRLNYLSEEENRVQEKIQHEKLVNSLINMASEIKSKDFEYNALAKLSDDLSTYMEEEKKTQEKIKYENRIIELIKLDTLIESQSFLYNSLYDLRNILEGIDKELEMATEERQKAEGEFNKLMPEVCPLCGQSIECKHK